MPNLIRNLKNRSCLVLYFCLYISHNLSAQLTITHSGLDSLICYNHSNGNVLLSVNGGTPPYQYLWDNGNTTSKRDSLGGGKYVCTITDNSIPKNIAVDTFFIYAPKDPIINFHPLKWDCADNTPFVRVDSFSNFVAPFYGVKDLSVDRKDTIWNRIDPIGSNWWAHYSDEPVSYNETFVIKDSKGCKMINDHIIDTSIRKLVKVGFDPFPFAHDTTIDYGQTIRLGIDLSTYSLPKAVKIQWSDDKGLLPCANCRSIFMKPSSNTTYRVEVSNPTYGCVSSHEFKVFVREPPPNIIEGKCFIPNIFSPDYNGYNDYFLPYFNESLLQIKRMVIYNRWGGVVFEKSNFLPDGDKVGWDGRHQGRVVPNGVYLYVIEVEWKNHTFQTFNGDVYLLDGNN